MKRRSEGFYWDLPRIKSRSKVQGDCWIWQGRFGGAGPTKSPVVNAVQGATSSVRRLVLLQANRELADQFPKRHLISCCGRHDCVSPVHVIPKPPPATTKEQRRRERRKEARLAKYDEDEKDARPFVHLLTGAAWKLPKKLPVRWVFDLGSRA